MLRSVPVFFAFGVRRCFSSEASTVGFIGLGNMGFPMASNLLKAGVSVAAFDVHAETLKKLGDAGAKTAKTPAEVAAQASTVITMLPSSPFVQGVLCNADGVFSQIRPNTLIIDCSTIDPSVSRELSALAAKHGGAMVDAPVSGGTGGAQAGTLTFMVGGDQAAFDRSKTVLQHMGKNIVHCGGSGNGQVAKLCNNLILGVTMAGVSEAMNLGTRLGIDANVLAGIINTSTGRCWSSDTYNPYPGVIPTAPASRGYTGGFGCDLMAKDLSLAVNAGVSSKSSLPMGALAHQMYRLMSDNGGGNKDFSGIIELLQRKKE